MVLSRQQNGSGQLHSVLAFLVLPFFIKAQETEKEPGEPGIKVGDSQGAIISAWIGIVFLIAFSGLFSGLNLGLMGLDIHGLEVVMAGKDQEMAAHAKKIVPLRRNGNLLLCTLIFGNVAVISMTSIIMADLTSGLVGFLTSTIAIVIFGEIIPQAACSRYALQIGAKTVCLVKAIMVALYPMAKPIALILDGVLGEELGTIHTREELDKLLEIHVREGAVDHETGQTLKGALRYKDLTVMEAMTPLAEVFMIDLNEVLSFETMVKIFKAGYSRIPVYQQTRNQVVGLLLTKDLIFIDPNDKLPISVLMKHFGRKDILMATSRTSLDEILPQFLQGHSHMAIISDTQPKESSDARKENDATPTAATAAAAKTTTTSNTKVVKGIVTLEDVLEIILGRQIKDEKDIGREKDQVGEAKLEQEEGGGKVVPASVQPVAAAMVMKVDSSRTKKGENTSKCAVKTYQAPRTARDDVTATKGVKGEQALIELMPSGGIGNAHGEQLPLQVVVVPNAQQGEEEEDILSSITPSLPLPTAPAAAAPSKDEDEGEEGEEKDQQSIFIVSSAVATEETDLPIYTADMLSKPTHVKRLSTYPPLLPSRKAFLAALHEKGEHRGMNNKRAMAAFQLLSHGRYQYHLDHVQEEDKQQHQQEQQLALMLPVLQKRASSSSEVPDRLSKTVHLPTFPTSPWMNAYSPVLQDRKPTIATMNNSSYHSINSTNPSPLSDAEILQHLKAQETIDIAAQPPLPLPSYVEEGKE